LPPEILRRVKKIEYIIPVKGLALGDHHYSYKIDDSFFSSFEYLDSNKGLVNLTINMVKESNLMDFKFHFEGYIEVKCDRCLDKFNLDVEGDFRLIVNYGSDFEEVSDEIITIPNNDANVDLSQFIYEYINLMLPIKKVHPDDEFGNSTCNQEMIDRLHNYSERIEDPRWDALKNIKID